MIAPSRSRRTRTAPFERPTTSKPTLHSPVKRLRTSTSVPVSIPRSDGMRPPPMGLLFAWSAGSTQRATQVVEALRQVATGRQGSLVVLEAPPPLLRQVDVWGTNPALEVMQRLKARFDPPAILNPGVTPSAPGPSRITPSAGSSAGAAPAT